MGTLYFKSDSDRNIHSKQNRDLAQRLQSIFEAIPGGSALFEDALRDKDVTINLTNSNASLGYNRANWDLQLKQINILFPQSPDILLEVLPEETSQDPIIAKKQDIQFDFLEMALFELCNAANDEANAENTPPLLFPTRESFARHCEYLEYLSHQRRATIFNAAIDTLGWQDQKMPVYNDDFDTYYEEMCTRDREIYGPQKNHANYYRNNYDQAFHVVRDFLLKVGKLINNSIQRIEIPNEIKNSPIYINNLETELKKLESSDINELSTVTELLNLDIPAMRKIYFEWTRNNDYTKFRFEDFKRKTESDIQDFTKTLSEMELIKSKMCSELQDYLQFDTFLISVKEQLSCRENMLPYYEKQIDLLAEAQKNANAFYNRLNILEFKKKDLLKASEKLNSHEEKMNAFTMKCEEVRSQLRKRDEDNDKNHDFEAPNSNGKRKLG